jgi:hypothetical protein
MPLKGLNILKKGQEFLEKHIKALEVKQMGLVRKLQEAAGDPSKEETKMCVGDLET